MKKQMTKLGARILSPEELNAILPNAESVYDQIDVFRNSISGEDDTQNEKQREIEQKTNNIGIMGCRGAGKTSILKTFYHKLKEENGDNKRNGDIILPIMIPENMSDGMTLMDAVLGRMKSIVEEREREKDKDRYRGDCIHSEQDSLEKRYNEMVKQYCYIKKDYRDILIQEFTTEQNYVDKTKKVFGSDSEFIKLFHQFVDRLLQEEGRTKETNKPPMLFLFIDDIDLSANRCVDIVRTLLVYLSHPRIITFISGDIDTFEEELTLEFLRQEGAIHEGIFQKTYYAANDNQVKSSLLERKKTLAYEYLKKIIPPAYRRMIRHWPLDERGNYRIVGDRGNASKSLAELLREVTKEQVGDLYFVYREDGVQKCMGLAFHMFDDTARGLNNVYNVLQEIYDIQTDQGDMSREQKTLLFWRLIETMVDSKPLYAGHKLELLTKIIVLRQGQVKIDFANAYQLLYGAADGDSGYQGAAWRLSAEDRFSIFYLLDFADGLFPREQYEKDVEKYNDLKLRVLQEYLSDETIDNKIAQKKELLDCIVDEKAQSKFKNNSVELILTDILRECDFTGILHFIRYFGRIDIYNVLENFDKRYNDKPVANRIAYALFRAEQAISESEEELKENLMNLWIYMQETTLCLLDRLSLDPWVIYGRQLTADIALGTNGLQYVNVDINGDLANISFENVEKYLMEGNEPMMWRGKFPWAEYENQNMVYWIYYEKKLREKQTSKHLFNLKKLTQGMLEGGLAKAMMKLLHEKNAMNQFQIRALKDVNYDGLLEGKSEKEKRDIQVIEQIDKRGLWDSAYVKRTVCDFLKRCVRDRASAMCRGRVIFDATQFVAETYAALEECYKGSSGMAIIYGLESKIQRVLFLPSGEGQQRHVQFSDGRYYLRLEQALVIRCLLEEFLTIHRRSYYGKREARRLLIEVKELPILPHTEKWNAVNEELRRREKAFFTANPGFLRDTALAELERSGKLDEAVETIRKRRYDASDEKHETMGEMIREYLGEAGANDYKYVQFLVQKKQIASMKKDEETEPDWSRIEPVISEKDCLFVFQSYLRYLQANDSDAKDAGVQAQDVAKFAQYILDNEVEADEKVQNDFYHILGEELALTEEEYENLF